MKLRKKVEGKEALYPTSKEDE